MKRKPKTSTLKRKLDRLFSLMIRTRDADKVCISCWRNVNGLQAGHFVPRKILSTRWHPWNVNGECPSCNGFNAMHLLGYSQGLTERLGRLVVENLLQLAKVRWKPLPDQLERLILACDSPENYEEEWFLIQKEFAP